MRLRTIRVINQIPPVSIIEVRLGERAVLILVVAKWIIEVYLVECSVVVIETTILLVSIVSLILIATDPFTVIIVKVLSSTSLGMGSVRNGA
jgi:hypothetical protein